MKHKFLLLFLAVIISLGVFAQPTISSFSPTSGSLGTSVTITGSNFTSVTNVFFGNVPSSSFTIVNSNTITAVVGAGASGAVSVTTLAGTGSSPGFVHNGPSINYFTPSTGAQGTVVTIGGNNFTSTTNVLFGNVPAESFTVVNPSTITAVLGTGSTGSVSVSTPLGAVTTASTFKAAPFIASFQPPYANVGDNLIIKGRSFSPTPSLNTLFMGNRRVDVVAATDSTLTCVVPANQGTDAVRVSTNNLLGNAVMGAFVTTFNGGGGSFSASSLAQDYNAFVLNSNGDILLGDIDGDNKLDGVILSDNSSNFGVAKNTSTLGSINFSSPVIINSNLAPSHGAIADFNGDGKLDVVVANFASNNISFYSNSRTAVGQISLSINASYASGASPAAVCVGDFDMDGKLDVAVANTGSGTISIFRNTSTIGGMISFQSKVDIATLASPQSIAAADLDLDGKPDLVVTNSTNSSISLFKNNGGNNAISFLPKVDYVLPANPTKICVGDINGDNKQDIVVANFNATVSVFKNASIVGSILLDAKLDFPITSLSRHIALGDMNGDGLLDIVAANSSGKLSLLRNLSSTNTVNFEAKMDYAIETVQSSLAIGDLNGDGKYDVMYKAIFINALRNKFKQPPVISSFLPQTVSPGDSMIIKGSDFSGVTAVLLGNTAPATYSVTNDSTVSLIVGNGNTGNISVANIYATSTVTGFTFIPAPQVLSFSPAYGPIGSQVAINGLNFSTDAVSNTVYFGAVRAEVVIASANQLIVKVPAGASNVPITVSVNGLTAKADIAFVPTFTASMPKFSSLSFERFVDTSNYKLNGSLSTFDIDNDGRADIFLNTERNSGTDTSVAIFKSSSDTGTIAFSVKKKFGHMTNPVNFDFADLDRDSKKDVICGNTADGFGLSVYKNLSDNSSLALGPQIQFPINHLEGDYAIADDLDNDGKADIVYTGRYFAQIGFMRNVTKANGSLLLGSQQSIDVLSSGTFGVSPQIVLYDLNGDGKKDLIVTQTNTGDGFADNKVYVYRNISTIGNIGFAARQIFVTGGRPIAINVSDLSGDGKPELVTANQNGTSALSFTIFRNTSTSSAINFDVKVDYPLTVTPNKIITADLDGDGKLDIVIANNTSVNSVSVFKNLYTAGQFTSSSFDAKENYDGGTTPDIIAVDLDGDSRMELIAANYGTQRLYILKNIVGYPKIVPSGVSPVFGYIKKKVFIDESIKTHNNVPYVQRHYDIEPVYNASTATATVTLYYTQQEFNNFNAFASHGLDLPTGPSDIANKTNLRIFQFHGQSTSSLPGSYSGSSLIIDPIDNNIVWNATALLWEITFEVTGFSGFFVSSSSNNALPLQLLSFKAILKNRNVGLEWTTANEIATQHFDVERSSDGNNFVSLRRMQAAGYSNSLLNYQYNDLLPATGIYYYRLKMADRNGNYVYSQVVKIKLDANKLVSISPNPVKDNIVITYPFGRAGQIKVIDAVGKIVKKIKTINSSSQTAININGLPAGIYQLVWDNGMNTETQTIIKQ